MVVYQQELWNLNQYRQNNTEGFLQCFCALWKRNPTVWSRCWWALVGTVTAVWSVVVVFLPEAPLSLSFECIWYNVAFSPHANWKNKTYRKVSSLNKFCMFPLFCLSYLIFQVTRCYQVISNLGCFHLFLAQRGFSSTGNQYCSQARCPIVNVYIRS